MMYHRSREKVLSFRHPQPEPDPPPQQKKPPELHPKVRRRRLIWLAVMLCFFTWTLIELIIQQNRIWNKQAVLADQKTKLTQIQQENQELQKKKKKLHDPNYLMELSHKHGYGKPGEKNYQFKKEN